jgi:hypothetical protein
MVVPKEPFVLQGEEAISAVASTPRWSDVEIRKGRIVRPQEGLIVIAYRSPRNGTASRATPRTAPRPTGGSSTTCGAWSSITRTPSPQATT